MNKNQEKIYNNFEDAFPDGRLVEPGNGKTIRLREAIKKIEELGRPLTKEEISEFEYDD